MFTEQKQTTEQMTTIRPSSAQSDNSGSAVLGIVLILHLYSAYANEYNLPKTENSKSRNQMHRYQGSAIITVIVYMHQCLF